MDESVKAFIEEVSSKARFDIDFEFCKKIGYKSIDKGHSTEGVNLFNVEIAAKFLTNTINDKRIY